MTEFSISKISMKWRIVLAFAAVYLIWGSTYLAIRLAIETIPPYLMGGVRFLLAGGLLYAVLRWRGVKAPSRRHWRAALIVGALLLFGGNGGVMVAEQFVPSSLAALIIATVPLWMVLLNWKWGDRLRPSMGTAIGVGLGVIGIVLIVAPGQSAAEGAVNPIGLVILILASLSWSIGSLYSRRAAALQRAALHFDGDVGRRRPDANCGLVVGAGRADSFRSSQSAFAGGLSLSRDFRIADWIYGLCVAVESDHTRRVSRPMRLSIPSWPCFWAGRLLGSNSARACWSPPRSSFWRWC